jgi:hypothetical protein
MRFRWDSPSVAFLAEKSVRRRREKGPRMVDLGGKTGELAIYEEDCFLCSSSFLQVKHHFLLLSYLCPPSYGTSPLSTVYI